MSRYYGKNFFKGITLITEDSTDRKSNKVLDKKSKKYRKMMEIYDNQKRWEGFVRYLPEGIASHMYFESVDGRHYLLITDSFIKLLESEKSRKRDQLKK